MVLHEIYKEMFSGGKTFDPSRNHSITYSTLHNFCMIFLQALPRTALTRTQLRAQRIVHLMDRTGRSLLKLQISDKDLKNKKNILDILFQLLNDWLCPLLLFNSSGNYTSRDSLKFVFGIYVIQCFNFCFLIIIHGPS